MKKDHFMERSAICSLWAVIVFMLMTSSVFAADTSCKTKYPFILAHGMGYEPSAKYPNSFPGIGEKLRACGATVYFTTVPAFGSTRDKANAFKAAFLKIKAADGSAKFNVVGHSHGGVYTRDAITNLGLKSYVASLTTVASPHRGSEFASYSEVMRQVTWVFNTFAGLKPTNTDMTATEINTQQLTNAYMVNVFNPNTPNVSGVYYQSWTGAYKTYNVIRSVADFSMLYLATAMGITIPSNGADAMSSLYPLLPDVAGLIVLLGGGENDGSVSVKSAKWGTFLSVQKGYAWNTGVNHLDQVNLIPTGTSQKFDCLGYWVTVAKNLKSKGY